MATLAQQEARLSSKAVRKQIQTAVKTQRVQGKKKAVKIKKKRTVASEKKLIESTFAGQPYQGLDHTFLVRLAKLNRDIVKMGHAPITIGGGARSRAEQEHLFNTKPGLAARPGHSWHEFAKAVDLGSESRGVANKLLSTPEGVKKYGLWFPMGYEPWHIQPVEAKGDPAATHGHGDGIATQSYLGNPAGPETSDPPDDWPGGDVMDVDDNLVYIDKTTADIADPLRAPGNPNAIVEDPMAELLKFMGMENDPFEEDDDDRQDPAFGAMDPAQMEFGQMADQLRTVPPRQFGQTALPEATEFGEQVAQQHGQEWMKSLTPTEYEILKKENDQFTSDRWNEAGSSGFGIWQGLEQTRRDYLGENYQTTDPYLQLQAFRSYVRDRYGTPENALEFHNERGYY